MVGIGTSSQGPGEGAVGEKCGVVGMTREEGGEKRGGGMAKWEEGGEKWGEGGGWRKWGVEGMTREEGEGCLFAFVLHACEGEGGWSKLRGVVWSMCKVVTRSSIGEFAESSDFTLSGGTEICDALTSSWLINSSANLTECPLACDPVPPVPTVPTEPVLLISNFSFLELSGEFPGEFAKSARFPRIPRSLCRGARACGGGAR